MHPLLVVAANVKARTHAAGAELQIGLLMPAGLVAKSMTDHTRVEVCEGLGLVRGDKKSEICRSVFFECKCVMVHTFVAFRRLNIPDKGAGDIGVNPPSQSRRSEGPTLKFRATYRHTTLPLTIIQYVPPAASRSQNRHLTP